MKKTFEIKASASDSSARTGIIHTQHGTVETPAFAPVASQGTVKGLPHSLLQNLGAQLMLVNAYHLYLRPGVETISKLGGIHSFISWQKPVLSDSGGFQMHVVDSQSPIEIDASRLESCFTKEVVAFLWEQVANENVVMAEHNRDWMREIE